MAARDFSGVTTLSGFSGLLKTACDCATGILTDRALGRGNFRRFRNSIVSLPWTPTSAVNLQNFVMMSKLASSFLPESCFGSDDSR